VVFGREHTWEELKERGLTIAPDSSDYAAIGAGLRDAVLRLKQSLEGKQVP